MPICGLKVILLISCECTFMILAKFAQKHRRPLVLLPLKVNIACFLFLQAHLMLCLFYCTLGYIELIVISLMDFFMKTCRIFILLAKRKGCTGTLSARGLNSIDKVQCGSYKERPITEMS